MSLPYDYTDEDGARLIIALDDTPEPVQGAFIGTNIVAYLPPEEAVRAALAILDTAYGGDAHMHAPLPVARASMLLRQSLKQQAAT